MIMKAIEFLNANRKGAPGQWKEEALQEQSRYYWQRYSYGIAIKSRKRMKDLGMTQKELAEKMNCSQQYVSTLLKGQENLTLETIAKLESVLNLDFLGKCIDFGYTYPVNESLPRYLNDPDIPYGKPGKSEKSEKPGKPEGEE